ncbi:MAG: U32 family peptidase, partial [Acutalibacteraceae bacterium]
GTENEILKRLEALKERGVRSAWAGTLDGIALAQSAGLEVTAGYGSNIFNSLSAEKMRLDGVKKILLSTELNLAQIKNIGGEIPRGVFAYGRLPLMLTRNCPVRNVKTCAECKKSGTLTDRKNTVFPIECHNSCSDLLNSRPVYMADRLDEIKNVDFILLYFTDESADRAAQIINAYKNALKPQGEFTRGLFYRGVE